MLMHNVVSGLSSSHQTCFLNLKILTNPFQSENSTLKLDFESTGDSKSFFAGRFCFRAEKKVERVADEKGDQTRWDFVSRESGGGKRRSSQSTTSCISSTIQTS
ncbi:hypothetical protein NE237_018271 [Protea cynaroides]|uniref:Uncharacterized protein n=1 Tax=Protea cynaroides TaxID=273540 RepID=A0A9Q0K9M5_9MAGN|nr:hypothetical protein NE237_018271 [Protea cynaroides]